jgi:hypothetical protein
VGRRQHGVMDRRSPGSRPRGWRYHRLMVDVARRSLRSVWPLFLLGGSLFASSCSCDGGEDSDESGGSGGSGANNTGGGVVGGAGGSTNNGFTGGAGGGTGGGTGGTISEGGANEGCFFVPPPGDFAPGLDCSWNGPAAGSPYQNYNDVVMHARWWCNLTDDNARRAGDARRRARHRVRRLPATRRTSCCNTPRRPARGVGRRAAPTGLLVEHVTVGATEIEADTGHRRPVAGQLGRAGDRRSSTTTARSIVVATRGERGDHRVRARRLT